MADENIGAEVFDEESEAKVRRKKQKKRKNRNRKFPVFYTVYFSLIIIFFIALFFVLKTVKIKLAEYEASRPYHTVDAVMEEYFKPGCSEKLIKASGYEQSPFEDRSVVVNAVEKFLSDGAECYAVTTGSDELKYSVTSGDLKFASFVVAPSGEKDEADYDIYELKSVELLLAGSRAVNIEAPEGSKVYLNGILLTENEITEREELDKDTRLPEEIPAEAVVTYEVKGLMEIPVVTAKDKFGRNIDDIKNEDDVFFDVPKTYEETPFDVTERALAAGEALAAYMQLDAGFWKIGQYVDSSSDLYYELMTSAVNWADPHNGYSIENPTVTEYEVWSDTVYTCRVKFLHVLYNWGGNFENYFDTTFYYKLENGTWLIYDSRVN